MDRASRVTYKVSKGDDHPVRLVHREHLKLYVDWPLSVNAVTLVAEEHGISPEFLTSKVNLSSDRCPGFRQCELDSVLGDVKQHFSTFRGLLRAGTCQIMLVDGAAPVNLPPRQIPAGIRDLVKAELDRMISDGIIVESNSVPVRKKDNSIRLCVDYRMLNSLTPLRRYWLPSLAEILEKVGPNMCLSTLDLTSEFHQSAMNLVSSEMTTFVCPFGKRYLRMPFRL